jgi:hypothetical protein
MPGRFFLLIPLLLCFTGEQPKLVKKKITDEISARIPENWKPMDDLDFTERYPSVRAPLAAFTNQERTADFSVNISATRWPDGNLEIARDFFKASLRNMFDRIQMAGEGIREVNGKSFIYFEFESRVNGNQGEQENSDPIMRYTYLQYLIQPRRTLVFSFSCPRHDRPAWEKPADTIMKSIRIK